MTIFTLSAVLRRRRHVRQYVPTYSGHCCNPLDKTDWENHKTIIKNTVYDKKNIAGEVSFILISDFGAVFAKKFSESELLNYECKN